MEQQQITVNQKEYLQGKLQDLLNENKISYFRILESTSKKSNFYVEKEYSIESILKAKRQELYVTLKTLEEDKVGESTFTITPQDTNNEIDKEIKDCIFICSQSKNQKYNDIQLNNEKVNDSHINYESFINKNVKSDFEHNTITLFIEEKLHNFKKIIKDESNENEKIRLNAMELLVSIGEKKLTTSTGINKKYEKDSSYLEIVLTAIQKDGNESEHILYQKINELYTFDFESFLRDAINKIKDALHANKAESFEGEVTLKGTACTDFFIPDLTMNAFIGHCSSRLKYQKVTNYEVNKEPIKAQKDKLTIYFDPLLPQNNASVPFDLDGIAAHKIKIINQNVVERFFASSQYAQYLNIEATGPMGSIVIEAGSLNEEIRDGIEIHTFSSFVPDLLSGNFSAEVRLGYHIKDGVKTPFKGGLFTGNIFKLLEDCELSKEIIEESGYKGPKSIKFYKGELVGL